LKAAAVALPPEFVDVEDVKHDLKKKTGFKGM
jgi:hypothetical protein